MTHTELITLLRTYVGEPTVADVPDATLTANLNRAYKNICDRYKLPQCINRSTFSTAIGTTSYNLASTDVWVLDVWNRTHKYKLKKMDPMMLIDQDDTSMSVVKRGRPRTYYRNKNALVILPTPDAVYNMELVTKITPTALSSGSDVPVINELWHEGIALLARWYYFDSRMDYPKAQYAYSVWQQWVQTKPNEMHQESVDLEEGVEIVGLNANPRKTDFDYQ
jgi:hypothetical protein